MSDIVFIKTEQDYFEYKKLKPSRIFSRKRSIKLYKNNI